MERGTGLAKRIKQAVGEYRPRLGSLSPDDLEALDAFHAGGRIATRELAELAGITPGIRVLDIGCGLGGPARALVTEYQAWVVGMDHSSEMVSAGAYLNQALGLAGGPRFMVADGGQPPFVSGSFDVIWLQHLLGSVQDKDTLAAAMKHILTPSGIVALHEVFSVGWPELDFPLPWASEPKENFLCSLQEFIDLFSSYGLVLVDWVNWTEAAMERFVGPRPEGWRYFNLKLVLGGQAGIRVGHLTQALSEGKAQIIQAVFRSEDK